MAIYAAFPYTYLYALSGGITHILYLVLAHVHIWF